MTKDLIDEEEISLTDIINVIKKRIKFILIFTFLVTIISIVITFSMTKLYEANAILKIGRTSGTLLESVSVTNEIITSFTSLEKIAKELNIQPTEENLSSLKERIKIEGKENLMNISVRDISPEKAEKLCNVVVNLILERHKNLYENLKENLRKSLIEIGPSSGKMQITIGLRDFTEEQTVVDSPVISSKNPVFPQKKKIVITVFVISLITSIFISFFMEGIESNSKKTS